MKQSPITATDVREFQVKTGCSIWEAKKLLLRQRDLDYLTFLRSSGTLEEKVNFLIDFAIDKIKG